MDKTQYLIYQSAYTHLGIVPKDVKLAPVAKSQLWPVYDIHINRILAEMPTEDLHGFIYSVWVLLPEGCETCIYALPGEHITVTKNANR